MLMCCLLMMGGGTMAFAQNDDYNPTNPAEPNQTNFCRVTVSTNYEEGSYVFGSGKFIANGDAIYISTNANNNENYTYNFLYWTLNGEKTSYSQSFYFSATKGKYNFVAHYEKVDTPFEPESPAEPSSSTVKRKYYLYLKSNIEGACSFNMASGVKTAEESQLYIEAYMNFGYQFEGWKMNGQIISESQWLYFTMPSANTTLEACFSEIPFDPENPQEPSSQGGNIDNSTRKIINLTIGPDNTVIDKTRIVINEEKTLGYDTGTDASKFVSNDADYQIYSLDAENTKYSINERPKADGVIPLGIMVKNAGNTTISAARLDCTAYLIDNVKGITHDLAVGGYTFTSEAGTFDNRFTINLSPNYILGDANGDEKLTAEDALLILQIVAKKIKNGAAGVDFEAADVNKDGSITSQDAALVLQQIVGK